ncbi:MAG TPA: ATP-dependent DNA ligase [Gemmatimonadaceae bacterium]|nr:ATP-dependent DNA ligase [Gemmatimonadaceae bacterium]
MRRFAALFAEIDGSTRTNEKVDALVRYFSAASAADAAWAVYFLSGGRPKRLIPVRRLAMWAGEEADVPPWLFEECYAAVGDLAETIALLLPTTERASDRPLHDWVDNRLLPLAGASESEQRRAITEAWRELGGSERLLWNKLITGAFRVGVSRQLVIRALSRVGGVAEGVIAHRLTGTWTPTATAYRSLFAEDTADADPARPYPFFLAYPLEAPLETLGGSHEWQVEWKWDGIRAQLLRRGNTTYLWTRGEELVTDRYPEIVAAAEGLPNGTVIDGEIMPWMNGAPLPFAQLQRRIGRKTLSTRIRAEVPVVLIAYDLLEVRGNDLRERPLAWRRDALRRVVADARAESLLLSPVVETRDWETVRGAHAASREQSAEGLMLKRLDSAYGVGRRKGAWWKWKVAPYAVDAVLVYAQAGSGRRASLHTDYTFAVRDGDALVPFAKAYSGLTDAELRELDAWIRRNTVEKFGPVRSVRPEQVFELHFEGIAASTRHKSGIAVRFPRIARWRTDKTVEEADSLETLRALLAGGLA